MKTGVPTKLRNTLKLEINKDFYDLHSFFIQGLRVNKQVVEKRMGVNYKEYLKKLAVFIEKRLERVRLS